MSELIAIGIVLVVLVVLAGFGYAIANTPRER